MCLTKNKYNTLITLCARGGSKGIPGKNIKLLNGKPLIAYSIEIAKVFAKKYSADIALSTDSKAIQKKAEEHGLKTSYQRPAEFATDKAGKIKAINDIVIYSEKNNAKQYDFIIDLDVTSPLRTLTDLEGAFNQLLSYKEAFNIFSVSPANRNPYFNMVEVGENGYSHLVKSGKNIKSRQDAPTVYDMNASFYVYRRSFFDSEWEVAITDKSLAYVVPHVCFDLDHPIDFVVMEILLNQNLLDFQI
jgi:CMP-N,N'-diacetyllegionaminic acid synthase